MWTFARPSNTISFNCARTTQHVRRVPHRAVSNSTISRPAKSHASLQMTGRLARTRVTICKPFIKRNQGPVHRLTILRIMNAPPCAKWMGSARKLKNAAHQDALVSVSNQGPPISDSCQFPETSVSKRENEREVSSSDGLLEDSQKPNKTRTPIFS